MTRNHLLNSPRPSVSKPRPILLDAVLAFVQEAASCPGVERIALVGSLATEKPIPKDADVLVTFRDGANLASLAHAARRLKGRAQAINLGADIFLCDPAGTYVGRICGYRECRPRALCQAQHCGERQHLNDDLHIVTLGPGVMSKPPFVLWPTVARRSPAPEDVETLLLARLERR